MATERKVKQWITVNGHHIPIFEGESKQDAVDRATEENKNTIDKDQDEKEKQIAANKKEADELNSADKYNTLHLDKDKPGTQRTVDYNDINETPEAFKKRAKENGYEILGEGGHSVTLRKREKNGNDEAYENWERLKEERAAAAADKNRQYFEQGKKDGSIPADEEYRDYMDYSPLKDDPNYNKKRKAMETAAENDHWDKVHAEGKYADPKYAADVADARKAEQHNANKSNIPPYSQEQLGKFDKYKKGFRYENAKEVNVNGNTYKVWSDTEYKGTFAEDKDGNVLPISGSGYLSNELSQRKAIANTFGESSFRSKGDKVNAGGNEIGTGKAGTSADSMSEAELRDYIGKHGLAPKYNKEISTLSPGSEAYTRQRIMKKIVDADMAKQSKSNTISKDFDTKEKQIAAAKSAADERNGKKSDVVKYHGKPIAKLTEKQLAQALDHTSANGMMNQYNQLAAEARRRGLSAYKLIVKASNNEY